MLLAPIAFAVAAVPQQVTPGKSRLTVTKSTKLRLRNATYSMRGGDETKGDAAVTVRGNGITVDFNGATFEGSPKTAEPDARKGLGVKIEGKNVTVKNLRVRGYMVGIMARNCPGLKLIDCDASYNWKQHLLSDQDKEDGADWMSYHHNEKDEWLRYGAGIYLRGCTGFEVRGCKAEGGQCGLMMTDCDKGLIWNNDFSFLSGIGLGMYHCSNNRIMHNKIDWCVRGFSYGKYNRGQDSAGILIYEQSMRNVFAYNSVTHGGDGFFLWAGQTTMDTGQGGCNDNLLYGNDFSHAPTNGIEATFSRNNFVNNLVLECWHGIWGGYSYESKVIGNVFGYNAEAIAWEHGQDNSVQSNFFIRDNEGVVLWSNPQQDPNWGYAKKRDTRSRDWHITSNEFFHIHQSALRIRRSENLSVRSNTVDHCGEFVRNGGEVTNLETAPNRIVLGEPGPPASSLNQGNVSNPSEYHGRFAGGSLHYSEETGLRRFTWNPYGSLGDSTYPPVDPYSAKPSSDPPSRLKGGQNPFLSATADRGWRYIIVDEWGPYDFKRPLLWPREDLNPGVTGKFTRKRFEILGPKGKWRVVSKPAGVILSKVAGTVPDSIDVTLPAGQASNVKIELEYTGAATTDYRGIVTHAGKPVRFGYSKSFAPIDWTIRFYKWSKSENPSEPHANPSEPELKAILKGPALKELKSDKLDFAGSAFDAVTGNDHFATVADGTFTIQPGDYTLEMTADDGARLWLDGKPLIQDAWHYQGPTLYARDVHLGAGQHTIRVEHFQIDGYGALKVNLRPKK